MSDLNQAPTDDEREALAHAIRKGSGASRYQSILLADQILPHLDGFRRLAHTKPTDILFSARQGGKSQALIDSMLTQANERGIRVEVVYPQTEPTDAQVNAASKVFWDRMTREAPIDAMRAALKAAFTAGQEEKS